MQPDRVLRIAEIAYIILILAVAVIVWRDASQLPPAPYDSLGPKSFPIWVSFGLLGLAAAMSARLAFGRTLGITGQSMVIGLDGETAHAPSPWTACLTLLLALVYAGTFGLGSIPFLPATAAYLFLASAVLGPLGRKRIAIISIFALSAAAALDFLFRVIFKLDLA